MSRPSLRVLIWLLAACSARTSELLAMVVMMLVGVADSRLARQLLMSSPKPVGLTQRPRNAARFWSPAVLCRFQFWFHETLGRAYRPALFADAARLVYTSCAGCFWRL